MLSEERFWELIEQSKKRANAHAMEQEEALEQLLEQERPEDIQTFALVMSQIWVRLSDLYEANVGCSDSVRYWFSAMIKDGKATVKTYERLLQLPTGPISNVPGHVYHWKTGKFLGDAVTERV